MSDTVEQARALLALFARSPWRDLHLRGVEWEVFLAKPGGAANPMHSDEPAPEYAETLAAPHLGLFRAGATIGAVVEAGAIVAQIEVLGEREPLVAPVGGRVAAILADDGALVEYDAPLLRIAP